MDLFTYLMAKNGNNSSVHGDLFSYLLGKGQSQIYTVSGTTIYIPNAKKLVSFMMTKESTQENIAYVDVGEWEQGTINSNGENQESSSAVRTKDYIKVHPNVLYNISRSIYNSYMGFRFYDINNNYLGNHGTTGMVETNRPENRMVANDSNMTMTILNSNVAYLRMFDNSNNLNTIYTISTENTPSPDYPQEVNVVEGYRNLFDGILEQGSFNTNSGELTDDTRRVRTTNYIEVNNEQYYFNMQDNSNYQIVIYVYDMNENYIKAESNTNWLDFPYIKSFEGQRKIKFGIRKKSNTAISVNEPQKVVMFLNNQNVNELPYVPYGNNYILYKQVGKNLFDKDNAENLVGYALSGTNGGVSKNNERNTSYFIELKPNTNYFISGATFTARVLYNENQDFIKNVPNGLFTTTEDTKYIRFAYVNTNDYSKLQLEEGTSVTEFEEYQENNVPIPLNNNIIAGIGDYKDELLVDENGSCWLNKKIGKHIFNGNENWSLRTNDGINYCYSNNDITDYLYISDIIGMSNYFKKVELAAGYVNALAKGVGFYFYYLSSSTSRALYLVTNLSTTSNDLKNWLSNNNVIVYYPLAEPRLIDLNTTVDLKLFKGVNNISNSEDGYMTIKYK